MPIPTSSSAAGSASATPATSTPASAGPTAAGATLLLVAAASAATLAAQHLWGLAIPGCGGGGPCDKAAKSVWGSIPLGQIKWPVSFLGAAFFAGLLVAWLLCRGRPTVGLRWLARLGAVASLFFIGVMVKEGIFCQYCLASHAANLLFVGLVELTARRSPRAVLTGAPPVMTGLLVAAAVTAGLAIAKLNATEHNAKELADSTARIRDAVAGAQPPTGPKPVTGAPASTGVPAPTGAPAPLPRASAGGTGFTGRYRLGPESAPIRIVMITDYQCPDCKHFEAQAFQILAERTNVSLSVKHFPFCTDCNKTPNVPNLHANACWAARAAEAAGMLYGPDGFWKMHRWLFERAGAFTDDQFKAGLAQLGFDAAAFLPVMQGPQTLANVQADITQAVSLGLQSTPMMFINGVELKGWAPLSQALKQTVDSIAANAPPAAAPVADNPPTASERTLDDWRNAKAMAWPLRKQPWTIIPESAPVRITMWGDLLEPNCAAADRTIRDAIAGRSDIRYEFRYFPFDQSCNPTMPRTLFPLGCRAAKAAEAAGQLGGIDAYWAMHVWIMEHQKEFSDQPLRAIAPSMGLDPDKLFEMMSSQTVADLVGTDANIGYRVGIPEIPRIFINGKLVTRWNLPNEFIIERVIEEAARPAPAK